MDHMSDPDYYLRRLNEVDAARRAIRAAAYGVSGVERRVSFREAAFQLWLRMVAQRGQGRVTSGAGAPQATAG